MIKQGSDLTADVIERCDVVVIGTGCGGASLAARLSEAGRDVVLLEQGGYWTSKDFDQRELHMLAKIDGGRGLDASHDVSASLSYGNNVGGASVHYWADSYRTPADRLELWHREHGLQGHGIAELTPHFEAIERDLSVHTVDDSYVNRMNALVKQGADKLGWHTARVPVARAGCVRSGFCMQGCAYDAKQSQLVTYIPRALAAGARLYADCRVEQMPFDGARVKHVDAAVLDRATGEPPGVRVRVEAKAVVVAAGGLGTPTLLLRQGLKERLPLLGERFFCNPCPMVHARFDEDIVQWRNIPAAWGVEEFRLARFEGDRYVEGGFLLMPNQLQPATLAAVLPGFGAAHRDLMTGMGRMGGTIAWIDDVEPGSVRLDGDRRRVHVPLDGGNGLRIRDAWRKQAQLLFATGARELIFGDAADSRITRPAEIEAAVAAIDLRPARNVFAAPHPGGAARMGRDPSESVVGFDHRVHGTDNLYVADPSVFPSPPSVDPSVTIMAFSRVAADHIHAAL
jgi:choline dehydrogenase-like flavoprotein